MLKEKNTTNEKSKFQITLLHLAAATGNVSLIKYLIELGADPKQLASFGVSPLHLAIQYCELHGINLELIKSLHLDKETVNQPRADGIIPLLLALSKLKEPLPIVELLLEHGADPNVAAKLNKYTLFVEKEKAKVQPIFLAVENGDRKLVKLFIDYGATLHNVYNEYGLPLARQAGNNYELLQLLIKKSLPFLMKKIRNTAHFLYTKVLLQSMVMSAIRKYSVSYLLKEQISTQRMPMVIRP